MRLAFSASVLALAVALAACDSGGDGGPIDQEEPEIEGSMTAELSGRAFEADSIVFAQLNGTTLIVEGADSSGRMIRISLFDAQRGTFVISGSTSAQAHASYADPLDEYEALSDTAGTLSLTRFDSLAVRGTFSFLGETLDGTRIVVSNGTFLAPWIDEP